MGIERRRHARIAGPLDGFRVGLIDTPVRIYDISEGGCFVNSLHPASEPGRQIVLKIELPDDGWITLNALALYAKPEFGFAVSFIEVPAETADRLRKVLRRLAGLPEFEDDNATDLEPCPRCHSTSITPTVVAGSRLPWMTCRICELVWAPEHQESDGRV
jgi:hypothetical protein